MHRGSNRKPASLFFSLIALAAAVAASAVYTPVQAMQAGAQQAPPTSPPIALPQITPLPKSPLQGEIFLYPSRLVKGPSEQWETYLGGPIVRNVINPTLTVLAPPSERANGAAIIYAPGGGFRYLAMGDAELGRLREQGFTVFLLKYRLEATDRDPPTFLKNLYAWLFGMVAKNQQADPSTPSTFHAPSAALADGLAAVRLVRSRAREWQIDPHRVGFMGGSAGAVTGLDIAFTEDAQARPDFVAALYGPKAIAQVPATAPPLFLASSVDDPLFPGTSENIVAGWSKAGRPVEAHFYEKGGHGLAAGTTGANWFEAFMGWARQHGWTNPRK